MKGQEKSRKEIREVYFIESISSLSTKLTPTKNVCILICLNLWL